MKILYVRCSTLDQRTDRQKVNETNYDFVVEDKCSGAVPFFERNGGKEILNLTEKGHVSSLHFWSIDRAGRNLRDIINTIHYFTERNICIHFESQCLRTLDETGKENPISKMMISILGVVSEMERTQIRERQLQGIQIAKARGVYKGRQTGSAEDTLKFLSKPDNKKVLDYLKKGYKAKEAALLAGVHPNTVTKIKKLAFPKQELNVAV